MLTRWVEIVQSARDQEVSVGVKVLAEFVALIAQVTFDLELHLLRRVAVLARIGGLPLGVHHRRSQIAPKFFIHDIVAQVGDVAHHARDAQASLGDDVVLVKVPVMKVRVGHDGAARHFIERNVFSGQVGGAGHHHRMAHARRVLKRPAQGLHAPEAAAHHGRQLFNAQRIEQTRLGMDPVFHRHHRKIGTVDTPGIGVHMHRAGGAKTRAQVVDANDEKPLGVDRLARANHVVPPALALGLAFVRARHMVRGVQGMANQHRVGALGIQLAISFIGQGVIAHAGPALQRQSIRKMHETGCGNQGHQQTWHR